MTEIIIIILAVLAGVTTQRILGFASAPIIVPVLLLYLSPPVSITAMLLIGGFAAIAYLIGSRKSLNINRMLLIRLLIPAVFGALLGAYVVSRIDKAPLQILIGLLIIVGAYIQEYRFPKPTRLLGVSKGVTISGFSSGFLNASAAMAFAPVILYLRTHVASPDQIRQNLSILFVLMNTVSIFSIEFFKPGTLTGNGVKIFLLLIPVILTGNYIGKYVSEKIDHKQYQKITFVGILLAGSLSVVAGLANL